VKYSGESRWIGIHAFVTIPKSEEARKIRITFKIAVWAWRLEMPHIFEPFYRGAAVTAAQIHGTVFDCLSRRAIAEAMGGTLSVVVSWRLGYIHPALANRRKQESEMASVTS